MSREFTTYEQELLNQIEKGRIYNIPYGLRNDLDFVLAAVLQNGNTPGYASKTINNDTELVLQAVKESGLELQYASEDLRKDRKFVLEAVKNDGETLDCASDALQANLAKEWLLISIMHSLAIY